MFVPIGLFQPTYEFLRHYYVYSTCWALFPPRNYTIIYKNWPKWQHHLGPFLTPFPLQEALCLHLPLVLSLWVQHPQFWMLLGLSLPACRHTLEWLTQPCFTGLIHRHQSPQALHTMDLHHIWQLLPLRPTTLLWVNNYWTISTKYAL